MVAFPHRCSACRARQTFKRHWESYIIKKQCISCGHDKFTIDTYRRKTEHKKVLCKCDGYHFPHRKGSLHCFHSTLSLEDYEKKVEEQGRYPL